MGSRFAKIISKVNELLGVKWIQRVNIMNKILLEFIAVAIVSIFFGILIGINVVGNIHIGFGIAGLIISGVGVFVAILAVGVSIYIVKQNNKHNLLILKQNDDHNRISVRPVLVTHAETGDTSKNITFELINQGMGPAKIKQIEYCDNDAVFGMASDNEVQEYLEHLNIRGQCAGYTIVGKGTCILPGDGLILLSVDKKKYQEDLHGVEIETVIDMFKNKIKINVIYESMYGEEDNFKD